MKLWVETDSVHSAGRSVRAKVSEAAAGISRQAASRGVRAVNALRNAELNVLKGQRSGKRYRKYPYKSMYTASAPGEPPARRTGNLRLHWNGQVKKGVSSGNGVEIIENWKARSHMRQLWKMAHPKWRQGRSWKKLKRRLRLKSKGFTVSITHRS